jgi:hypothetical protein
VSLAFAQNVATEKQWNQLDVATTGTAIQLEFWLLELLVLPVRDLQAATCSKHNSE